MSRARPSPARTSSCRFRQGRWARIEGAGHTVHGDNPADLLVSLRAFLDEVAPRCSPGHPGGRIYGVPS